MAVEEYTVESIPGSSNPSLSYSNLEGSRVEWQSSRVASLIAFRVGSTAGAPTAFCA